MPDIITLKGGGSIGGETAGGANERSFDYWRQYTPRARVVSTTKQKRTARRQTLHLPATHAPHAPQPASAHSPRGLWSPHICDSKRTSVAPPALFPLFAIHWASLWVLVCVRAGTLLCVGIGSGRVRCVLCCCVC